jgi:hypothetical protein
MTKRSRVFDGAAQDETERPLGTTGKKMLTVYYFLPCIAFTCIGKFGFFSRAQVVEHIHLMYSTMCVVPLLFGVYLTTSIVFCMIFCGCAGV